MRVSLKRWLLGIAGSMCVVTASVGQDYPNKTVKIVVSTAPGGAPDQIARILGQKLSQLLGQPFVIENKPGAGGTLGAGQVAKMAPDGYTLMMGDSSLLVIAPFVIKDLPYEPAKAFTPIAMVGGLPYILVSNAKSQIKTIQDLIREAKANPGKINYGSPGFGSTHHIVMQAFAAQAGLSFTHIPYKGGGQSVPALLSGEVPVLITSHAAIGGHLRSGAVNLLAVTSANRFAGTPEAPALAEVFKGFDFSSEMGVLAPAGLPPDILSKLSNAIKTAVDSADVQERFKAANIAITYSTPEGYAESIRQNLKKYEAAVKNAKIQPN